ncbi:MAG: quinone-dependent dihydroorotate dehydrogenase [Actinomyces urogenitalis]|uniref:Dihydroorotate dehydrogenase (quinone) n=1 Tax=Actinomyces urogenitalis TaxID=103621 RepID=A0A2I1KUS0_9ACTO|nr:quinone-dependent dihydroorotate dehydrogenase [Actinomyces urogenitalis]MBS5977752.1 quinone-dependent dihydroorotate dehydrogenase [Actinomyces urogenitalis]MDU0972882.1 quinone-dependent dihydroorotate dehydrogenase [Actinomyces urogenitalis]MDU6151243.1 quinone-dependent dihydroorotate dehydrogenase [Actinomyces urogenitalis]PKY99366.1 dihydroorotate dehydrogenase (quinone) [Actinomyces urogenitalis]
MLYDLLYKTVLTRIDPEVIHDVCVKGVALTGRLPFVRDVVRQAWGRRPAIPVPSAGQGGPFARPVPGVLGLAAGMDKEGEAVVGMDALGFGFIEVGTFTAQAQPGNDKPRMWRYPATRAVRNRMGFNNSGADEAARRLRELRSTVRGRSIVVGANIGKTKVVPLEDAVEDYRYSAAAVARWADYLVVNVSSPNTPGLRDLQNVESLRPILEAVREAGDAAAHRHVPLLVKIAPDLADEDVDAVADLVTDMGLDGVVATNTTIDHDLGEGGLSGAPLLPRSLEVVRRLRARLGEGPTIIGVGGISSIMDAELMLDAGADLLQAYTAFIYNGPAWPGRINRALATMRRPR